MSRPWDLPIPPLPRVPGTLRADVAVVGLSAAGLSLIRQLQRRRVRRIVALDPVGLGAGGSGHDSGVLLPRVGWLGDTPDDALLVELAARHLDALLKRHRHALAPVAVHHRGPEVEARVARLQALGVPVRRDGDAWIEGGVLAHPREVLAGLADAAWEADAWMYAGPAIERIEPGVVTTAAGPIEAPNIVVAVEGGLPDGLAPEPLVEAGQVSVTAATGGPPGHLCAGGVRAQRRPDGTWILAAAEGEATAAAGNLGATPIGTPWTAPVSRTPTGRPLVGALAEGVYGILGLGAHGLVAGSLLGEALADDLAGRPRPDVLLALDRLARRSDPQPR